MTNLKRIVNDKLLTPSPEFLRESAPYLDKEYLLVLNPDRRMRLAYICFFIKDQFRPFPYSPLFSSMRDLDEFSIRVNRSIDSNIYFFLRTLNHTKIGGYSWEERSEL
jgi:hypothetical protein